MGLSSACRLFWFGLVWFDGLTWLEGERGKKTVLPTPLFDYQHHCHCHHQHRAYV